MLHKKSWVLNISILITFLFFFSAGEDGDTDQETDRLLGQQRSDDPGFYDHKVSYLPFLILRVFLISEKSELEEI